MPFDTPSTKDHFDWIGEARQSNVNVYPQLAAYDSSTIHAGDTFIRHYSNNNISTSGPVILLDRTLLDQAPLRLYSFVEQLQNTTLLLEEIQYAARQLEGPRSRSGTKSLGRTALKTGAGHRRKNRSPQLPPHATLATSISYSVPDATTSSHGTLLSMKVRFTIKYNPDSIFGSVSHWYEWNIDVLDPRHQRLLSSSCSGTGIADVDDEANIFPSSEVFVSLKQGWIWDGSNEFGSNSGCHTRAEPVDCMPGSRTFETAWNFRRCSCWLCQ